MAVVTFGGESRVESELSQNKELGSEYGEEIDPDGSDLAAAIGTALNLVNPARPPRLRPGRPARSGLVPNAHT